VLLTVAVLLHPTPHRVVAVAVALAVAVLLTVAVVKVA
jgi:hypothetical protein